MKKTAFPLGRALFAATIVIAASAALNWAAPAYLSPAWALRLNGALLGCVVVFYANVIPKSLTSLVRLRCSPAAEQAARRFAGWSLVLGGLGYILAMLLAPLSSMYLIGGAVLAVALAAAVLRCFAIGSAATRS
jgi:hypothetical protein